MVYKLLAQHDLRFVAVVRDKLRLVDCALQRRWVKPTYHLCALQRFYERGEARYLNFAWPQTLEVLDLDLQASHKSGQSDRHSGIFNKEHPLTLESRAGVRKKD